MKIGITSPYFDTLGGGERYMLTIAEYLSHRHEVDIFWDDQSITEMAYLRLGIELKKTHIVPNIFSPKHSVYERIRKSLQYDIIFFLSDGSIPVSLARKNIVHFQQPFVKKLGTFDRAKIALLPSLMVICNSAFTKEFIDQTYSVHSQVVFPPVDIDKFLPIPKKKDILSVGRFSSATGNKKQKEMIAFFNHLIETLRGWRLTLVGGLLPQDQSYFSELASNLRSTTSLKPNCGLSDLAREYGQSMIYWHAAGFGEDEKSHPERFEHFGISTVEAMSAGCVPIVFNGGGQREIISHGENGFLWNTEEELLRLTSVVATDDKLRKRLSSAAISASQQFRKELFCQHIERLVRLNHV